MLISPDRLGSGAELWGRRRVIDDVGGDVLVVGDSVIVTVTGAVEGLIRVGLDGTLMLAGIARAGIVVTRGGSAYIAGTTERLFVAVGGHAIVAGTCHGAAINDGGALCIEGIVEGPLVEYAGETVVSPRALLGEPRIDRGHPRPLRWPSVLTASRGSQTRNGCPNP